MTGALSADDGDLSALVGQIADEFLNDNPSEARRLLHQLAAEQPSTAAAVSATVPLLRLLALAPPDARCEQAAMVRLGDFQLLRPVAQGGMGVVYEATQLSLRRRVAVKVLTLTGTLDERRLRRFQVEARAASLLAHPHVVPVYAVGFDEGVHYYAMQFIDGHSLADPAVWRRLAPRERIEQIVRLGIQAAEALHYSHSEGVVHRDVKPSNLLVDASGHLWVADFGLAHMQAEPGFTATDDLLGTLCYMSPEQLQAAALVDHRTDVYSLGVTLYELLAERPAFGGGGREFVLRSILGAQLEPLRRVRPEIPRDLETVVRRATAADRDQRYPTAAALAEDLRRIRDGRPILSQRPSRWRGFRYWVQRNRLLAATSAALLATLLVLAVGGPLAAWRQRRLTAEAHTQLHISEMNLAYQAWGAGHVDRAAELLASREARPLYGDSRDFPHRHLQKLLQAAQQSVLYQHEGHLHDVVVSPDGRFIAYCGGDIGVRVLDARTHAVVASLSEPERLIGSVAFVDGGATLVASPRAPGLLFWDCADWSQREVELPLEAPVRVMKASPSSSRLAVGSSKGELALCDASGACQWRVAGHSADIHGIAFSPDESQIATVSVDQHVKLWCAKSGKLLKDLIRLRGGAFGVAWSDDGERLFVACVEGVRTVDVHSGALLAGPCYDMRPVACLEVHSGLLVTGGHDHLIALWDADSGLSLGTIVANQELVAGMTLAPTGDRLLTAGGDGTLRAWDVRAFRAYQRHIEQTDWAWSGAVAFARQEPLCVTVVAPSVSGDPVDLPQGKLTVWDSSTGELLRQSPIEPRVGIDAALSADGRVLATAGKGAVQLWDPTDLKSKRALHQQALHEFLTVAASPDGRWVVAGGIDRQLPYADGALLMAWDLHESQPVAQRLPLSERDGEIISAAFSLDGKRLGIARGNDDVGRLDVWTLGDEGWKESQVALSTHGLLCTDLAFFKKSANVATTGMDGKICIATPHRELEQFQVHSQGGYCLAISPDDALLAIGTDREIRLWDTRAKQQVATVPVSMWVSGIAFSPDGEDLVWTGGDGTVHWELNVRPLPAQ